LVITVESKQILIKHLSPEGKRLELFHAGTAKECVNWLIENFKIMDEYHALDIGRELEKAELALKNDLEYIQDQDLKI